MAGLDAAGTEAFSGAALRVRFAQSAQGDAQGEEERLPTGARIPDHGATLTELDRATLADGG